MKRASLELFQSPQFSLSTRFSPGPGIFATVAIVAVLAGCGSDDPVEAQPAATTPTNLAPVTLKAPALSFTNPASNFELANYKQTGRFSLPVGTGSNLLAEEASGVTFNKDTNTLFIVGDGGTAVTQVTKEGKLVDSMTLAADATKPQGTYFYDPEGIVYLGAGKFALVEERYRQISEFTYVANTTLGGAGVRTVKLGTTIGNVGIEGFALDPSTGGFVMVKESGPAGVFQTTLNFAAGTASNGSATADNSTNLFDPTKTGLTAHNDTFALSNILPSSAPDYSHILILSAPDGKIVKVDRAGNLLGTLNVGAAAQNEGMTMDTEGNIYVVSEVGGGPGRPEMLVFSPTTGNTVVATTSNLYLTFEQNVTAGAGSLQLSNGAGDTRLISVTDASQLTISGKTITLNPAADLIAGTTYSISYPAGLIKDAAGNAGPAVASNAALSFKAVGVIDTAPPLVLVTSPLDNATGITSSRVVLTFNEPVAIGVGSITISNGSGDSRVISITDATQVTVAGNTVNVNPSADLLKGANYNVQIPSGVIQDLAGNAYAGLVTTTSLDFTTAAAVPTTLSAGDLLFMAANAVTPDAFAFVLLKAINAGTSIGFSDRNYVAATGFPATGEAAYVWSANVSYPAGTIITIQTNTSPPIANLGTLQGAGGGLSGTAETVYAFQGSIAGLTASTAGAISVDRFIAALNIGTAAGEIPPELTAAGAYISFPLDNARYNGSLDRTNLTTFAALVKDFANWVTDDVTPYLLTAGSFYP
jgi:uncharacterized protein YjiK/methionine-rich copper-binding protein CopC